MAFNGQNLKGRRGQIEYLTPPPPPPPRKNMHSKRPVKLGLRNFHLADNNNNYKKKHY